MKDSNPRSPDYYFCLFNQRVPSPLTITNKVDLLTDEFSSLTPEANQYLPHSINHRHSRMLGGCRESVERSSSAEPVYWFNCVALPLHSTTIQKEFLLSDENSSSKRSTLLVIAN